MWIQNVKFLLDVHVLTLVGCDMVMGVQWFRDLGLIL